VRIGVALPLDETDSINRLSVPDFGEARGRAHGRYGDGRPPEVLVCAPAILEQKKGRAVPAAATVSRRQLIFRCVRLAIGGALLSSAVVYTRTTLTTATSEQAYINGEITALRAPIAGQLRLEPMDSGRLLPAGAVLFHVENSRFGNQEAASQLNWVTELAGRLTAERDEAAVRSRQQEEVYRLNQKLFEEKLISRLALLEEETKLALARTVMTNKETLAAQAQDRCRDVKRQVELQKAAIVTMPFEGAAWAVSAKNGAEVSTHETVVEVIDPKRIWVDAFFQERHAQKLAVRSRVTVRALDGSMRCGGTVEWIRGGVGRIPSEGAAAVSAGDYTRRRVAVRVRLDGDCTFEASEFFGVGRSVVVTVGPHE
jgi:multidrug resistance efflux pump